MVIFCGRILIFIVLCSCFKKKNSLTLEKTLFGILFYGETEGLFNQISLNNILRFYQKITLDLPAIDKVNVKFKDVPGFPNLS